MNQQYSTNKSIVSRFVLFCLLFAYVFAFYLGPVSISILIAFPLYGYAVINRKYAREIINVVRTPLITNILKCWFFIVFLGLLFPAIYLTTDFSFLKVIATQLIHYVAAFPVLAYITYKHFNRDEAEKSFIAIFVAQTIIQFVVLMTPSLRTAIYAFNRFDPDAISGAGSEIRGVALSAATTFHLTLAYGIAMIVYFKRLSNSKIGVVNLTVGVLLFVGIFCAGRSGFLGFLIGLMGYFWWQINQRGIKGFISTISFVLKTICSVIVLITILSYFSPDFYEFLDTKVFPYAFEAFYSKSSGNGLQTGSTNRLGEMWNENFNMMEFIIGSGKYSNPDGSYYMHVDPGMLRHTLFGGILFYLVMLFYQYTIIPFKKFNGDSRFYSMLIFTFIFLIDAKGCAVGSNKFMVSIPLLLSWIYLYLPKSQNYK